MTFSLLLDEKTFDHFGECAVSCTLEMSGQVEQFAVPTLFWDRSFYIHHWKKSFLEGFARRDHSALITSMRDPEFMSFLNIWVLYYFGDDVFIQNKILFLDEIDGLFEPELVNRYISPREVINEDGVRISQWKVALVDVITCFETLR